MLLPTRQDGSHHIIATHIPRVATGKRVVGMPADGNHPTPLVMTDHLSAYDVERDIVDVLLTVVFNLTDVKTHHGRIVARDAPHIGATAVSLPGDAVERIILVTEHEPVCGNLLQVNQQLFCLRRSLRTDHHLTIAR